MIKKHLLIILNVVFRNRMILTYRDRVTDPNEVNLHWWKMNGELQNIGDYLSPVICKHMIKHHGISNCASRKRNTHLYAVGSIIDGGYQNATIWGSGLLYGDKTHWWRIFRKLDIRCVRGPETRRVLINNGYDCPECYGDPALLMPLFYSPDSTEKIYKYRVIQHYSYGNSVPNCLDPLTDDWKHFIDELVQSERIISNSLHGIILAEAYGIPAVLLKHDMNMFKYRDYYYSTGRYDFPVANSVEEALYMEPAPLPNVKELQNNLLKSFPCDLYSTVS